MSNKPDVKESAEYDNYMDVAKRLEDDYRISLDKFFDQPIQDVLIDRSTKKKSKENLYKIIYVHFRNLDDLADFCKRIGQVVPRDVKDIYYPRVDPSLSLFPEEEKPLDTVDLNIIRPKKVAKEKATLIEDVSEIVVDVNAKWRDHWKEMPAYKQESVSTYRTINVKFRTEEHYKDFAKRIDQNITEKTKSCWHPKLDIIANRLMRWREPVGISPRYPVYIISKGRHESMFTSRSLARMGVHHSIAIEPQDEQNYEEALDKFGIREYVTLLIAPFSNHGDGPGRARNWCWDHSISIGAKAHWVLDDNISDFYRLQENMRIRVDTGSFFAIMEDFFDRYENLYIAGPQYRFFIAPNQKYPPFVANTRIYSCLLIRNDCKHRWRGRYNEDTDICLRVLKDGDCTVQFNAFMQGKAATQTVKGGNSTEFYHKEGADEGLTEEEVAQRVREQGKRYNEAGTINKSKMLEEMHPDVARVVWRYGRWHHYVDYSPFKKNRLILKDGVELSDTVNNYGLNLVYLTEDEAGDEE